MRGRPGSRARAYGAGRVRWRSPDTWRHSQVDHHRRDVPAHRACGVVCADPARDEGVLQLRQRPPAEAGRQARRGVGRQIVWKYYDDGYNPANTAQLTRRLVEQDKVFATVGQLGTEPILAARAYLNQQKVPQTLVSTGASYWGLQGKEYPWTIGWQPDYIAEGRLYGSHIKANHNGKKIAVLYQNDDYGKDYLYGVRSALGKKLRRREHRRPGGLSRPRRRASRRR